MRQSIVGLVILLAIMSLLSLGFVVGFYLAYDFDKAISFCKMNPQACDGIAMAYQLGRLDFVSMSLTLLTVVVGVLGIFGFLSIREKSELIAKKTAEKISREETELFIKSTATKIIMSKAEEIASDVAAVAAKSLDRTDVIDNEKNWGVNLDE